jgi:alkylated DNA repair dioxygenase AlkB
MDNQTFTITFGDQAENHVGMQKIGKMSEEGFSYKDLLKFQKYFENLGFKTDLKHLNEYLPKDIDAEDAYFLVIKKGLRHFLPEGKKIKDFEDEQLLLEKDKKCFMYGRVVNKKARHNLCFSEKDQEPDYEKGKGRIISFDKTPLLKNLREGLPKVFGEKAKDLQAEGNYYYDIETCGIGYHGDAERRIVIGLRLGERLPLCYQWYQESKRIGDRIKIKLSRGDIYLMSEKSVGTDWRKKKIATLRHAAGCEKFIE